MTLHPCVLPPIFSPLRGAFLLAFDRRGCSIGALCHSFRHWNDVHFRKGARIPLLDTSLVQEMADITTLLVPE